MPGLIVEGAGPAAEGFTWTIPTLPNDELPAPGRELAAEFEERYSSRPCCFSVHAAQTASFQSAIAPAGEMLVRR